MHAVAPSRPAGKLGGGPKTDAVHTKVRVVELLVRSGVATPSAGLGFTRRRLHRCGPKACHTLLASVFLHAPERRGTATFRWGACC